ncbi:hypothetical protein AURDEDRAFT_172762 [Auricularia subglabra TFB-10046 SS5]|nr:hypothetical protein AURDEDRAFT_172762 [Auricularia subglabra TFB-10046 SS5]
MKKVYKEMYESCFPVNFREDLRDKMMAATQHGRPIKDYAKDLENMALRYDDIDKGTVKRILWDGVDDYIRLYWIEKGLSLEFSNVPTLIYYAYRVERRELEKKRQEKKRLRGISAAGNHARTWRARRDPDTAPVKQRDTPGSSSTKVARAAASRPAHARGTKEKTPSQLAAGAQLTRQQKSEPIARNLCFHCHREGHRTDSCPLKDITHTARAAAAAPKTESPGNKELSVRKAKVKRHLRALPAASVRIMSITPALLNYVSTAVHIVEAETRMSELFRDEILAAALEFYNPLSTCPSCGNLGAPADRFLVETPSERTYPPVAAGTVSLYDALHDLELVFQLSEFCDGTFDIGRTFFEHFGIPVDERQCPLRVDVPDLPWVIPVRGVLTLINGEWASASTFYGLRQLGLEYNQRWVIQTDGKAYWARDFAFGLCYEVTVKMLRGGTTLEHIVHEPEFFDRRGEMAIPLVKQLTLGPGDDWQFPFVPSERVETRHAMWRQAAKLAQEYAQAKHVVADQWAAYDGIPAIRRFHRVDNAGSRSGASDPGEDEPPVCNSLGLYREVSTTDPDSSSSSSSELSSLPSMDAPDWSETEGADADDDGSEHSYRLRRPRVYVRTAAASTITSMAMWSDNDGNGSVDVSDMDVDDGAEQRPLLGDDVAAARARDWVAVSSRARVYHEHRNATERRRARVVRADEDPVLLVERERTFAEPDDFDDIDF